MPTTPTDGRFTGYQRCRGQRTKESAPVRLALRLGVIGLAAFLWHPALAQDAGSPDALLQEADRLAWLKAWTRAEPIYAEAQRLFIARGDRRNALYAEINRLRGQLPRLAVPEVSQRLADYLDDPILQTDDRVRLRCLVIKGETDEDLDPFLAEQSWREALEIANRLGDEGWANRARGELGLVAFLLGDISTSVIGLGQAMVVARSSGDVVSLVRWLTLFGHGYVELGRPEQALDYYDQALKAASTIPGLQFPVMTYLGKSIALVKLQRFVEAEQFLSEAITFAEREGALGYQAELTLEQGKIAYQRQHTDQALERLARAADLARRAGGSRILAEIAIELARIQWAANRPLDADKTLQDGIAVARNMAEQFLLPRLLAQLADLRLSRRQFSEAGELLEEASDLLEGLLTKVSSPWVRSRVIGGMDDVFKARIRLEAAHNQNPNRAFAVVEQARGRSLLELLLSTPVANIKKPPEVRARERELAALQLKLLRAKGHAERQRLLEQVFLAEANLGPVSTELFNRTRTGPRKPLALGQVQRALRSDEVFVEFALADPDSYCIVVTRTSARVQHLPGRAAIESRVEPLLKAVRDETNYESDARRASEVLLDRIPELASHSRIVVSPDGDLHQLPFELLVGASGARLLQTHIVSYVPSGSVLAIVRNRQAQHAPVRAALSIGASLVTERPVERTDTTPRPLAGTIPRGVYDLDASSLPPLPSANDEARAVGAILGSSTSTVLLGEAASELEVKRQPLQDYKVLHFAVHGILSTKIPTRSALLLRPAGSEDGLLQAGEILTLRLRAEVVTLSACDTGTGAVHGQEGVSSLVRPFLAAGAHAVVANLWKADDQFSLTLMTEFYRRLATGTDIAEALRGAKLKILEQFGPQAPKLWSGFLAYGDGASVVVRLSVPPK